MITPDDGPIRISPAPEQQRFGWRDALCVLIVVIGGAVMLVWHVRGRGLDMLVGYPMGVLAQVLFGALALSSAAGVLGVAVGPVWQRMLRVAGLFLVVDVSMLGFDLNVQGGAVGIAIVYLAAAMVLVEFRLGHRLFIAAILLLLKLVGVQMAEATVYTWF